MTINEADTLVRERCGNRKCEFELYDIKCINGRVDMYAMPYESCPHCHGTGYEPITLADVLMALEKHTNGDFISIGQNGEFFDQRDNLIDICWSLTTDFHGQDEAVRISIAELLK